MPDLEHLIDLSNPRIESLRGDQTADHAECVLWWISRAQRVEDNPAATAAIEAANRLNVPVIAVFCLVNGYPRATQRAYAFMLEGLDELAGDLRKRGIGWRFRVGDPAQIVPAVAREARAALVVGDLDPLRAGREWRDAVAAALDVPMVVVDADTVVPTSFFPKEEWAPRTIRPKINRLLTDTLDPPGPPAVTIRSELYDHVPREIGEQSIELDRSAGISPTFKGGSREAKRRLTQFVDNRLATYATDRNRAHIRGTSELSPYLHFGQIGVASVVGTVRSSGAPQESIDAFLNEIVVQRELSINFALRNPHYDAFAGLPDWGQKTLRKHAGDERQRLYNPEALETGKTDDPLWNAAQQHLVAEGWMPNRLRMYWAKRFLHWTATPEEAFDNAIALNDRYFIDGRDANGYAGIAWSIGGRHDRPFPPERPVSGLIRPMGVKGLRRHFDVDAYIAEVKRRYGG
ncbi:MAG: deoxyribodipyrimidine photo-lyase [Thermomicrobiales bacterium]